MIWNTSRRGPGYRERAEAGLARHNLSMKNYYDSGGRVEPPEPGELADDDLLAVLSTMDARLADSVSGEAIGTESLRQRVSVMRHRPRPGDRVRPNRGHPTRA